MRILYCAIDQTVPGTTGGSTHVRAVAEGLAALGHEVHVFTQPGRGGFPDGAVRWHALAPPLGDARLRWMRRPTVEVAARDLRVDVVIERYYNFGGEGMAAARAAGALGVLEVNAPIVDYPGSPKARLDRLLVVRPMERWRNRQVRSAELLVTPSAAIVPSVVSRDRLVELEWGADTERFRPDLGGEPPFAKRPGEVTVVFAGAFRAWHGAIHLVRALKELHAAGHDRFRGVFVGDGPERAAAEAEASGVPRMTFVGAVDYERVPAFLAHADIGAAPFDVGAHAPLQIAFYWSPLKIFEYMAAGLPVVAPDLPRLRTLVGPGAGLLYDESTPGGLADALLSLAEPALRETMGRAARTRAVDEFSWTRHCRQLSAAIESRLAVRQARR